MITVYGRDWCEDTRRALRHLRRLGLPHQFLNVDEDLDALERAMVMNGGIRHTPTIDLGLGGSPLIEPDNDTLTGALVEMDMLTVDDARERLGIQNVGDMERVGRTFAGLALIGAAGTVPRAWRWPVRLFGAGIALSGISGWCPAYSSAGMTSLGGPGDRPAESSRNSWVAPAPQRQVASLPGSLEPGQ